MWRVGSDFDELKNISFNIILCRGGHDHFQRFIYAPSSFSGRGSSIHDVELNLWSARPCNVDPWVNPFVSIAVCAQSAGFCSDNAVIQIYDEMSAM